MKTVPINSNTGMTFLTYSECETPQGSEYVILHKVEMGYSNCIELPLTDWADIEFFQNLLRDTVNMDVYSTESEALAHELEWREMA